MPEKLHMKSYTDIILPIVMVYEEQGQLARTEKSLSDAGFSSCVYADREGVGSMAKAFNRAVDIALERSGHEKYFWFLTNVTFPAAMPDYLADVMECIPECAAVHPAFHSSHGFIANAQGVSDAHFVEWTAPMVNIAAWMQIGQLDEQMPYVHFDLDWSQRAKDAGWVLKVDGRHRLDHTYLHVNAPERISVLRRELRQYRHAASLARIHEKYGMNWKEKLCKGGNCG